MDQYAPFKILPDLKDLNLTHRRPFLPALLSLLLKLDRVKMVNLIFARTHKFNL